MATSADEATEVEVREEETALEEDGDEEEDGEEKPTVVALAGEFHAEEDEAITETLRWAADAQFQRRSALPVKHQHDSKDSSLWSVLKKNIGKKLSHVAMPVTFNEPLSALQRLCEELEYSDILDRAAASQDATERLLLVAAFAVSSYGPSQYRSGRKPFNPILGETYDEVRPERGFRFVAEQVSHHPPVSVCIAESQHWLFYQEAGVKSSLRPSSLKITPQGFVRVTFPQHRETYEWQKVITTVEDIMSGNKWVDHHGKMHVVNMGTGATCMVEFTQYSRFKKSQKFNVRGMVLHPTEPKRYVAAFNGKWTEQLVQEKYNTVLWTNRGPPENAVKHGFGMTTFALELNELLPEGSPLRQTLPATDSRFRTDQRLWENADLDGATQDKLRVEELQRQRRKELEASGARHVPRLFQYRLLPLQPPTLPPGVPAIKATQRSEWVYLGGYWRNRRGGTLAPLPALW